MKFKLIHHRRFTRVAGTSTCLLAIAAPIAVAAADTYSQSHVRDVSVRCAGQNAEVEQAADPNGRYVYEAWIGCDGIGFARSTDGGLRFGRPIRLRSSGPNAWDPAITVAPSGTVYTAFMVLKGRRQVPVVLASFDHGATFPRRTALIPRPKRNWGDRPFIAAGTGRTVYLTWDYGPSASAVRLHCFPTGSCVTRAGDLNVVMQISTNGGKTFGPMIHLSPGFPAGGADSAPVLIDAGERIDVLYAALRVTRRKTLALGRGQIYFTSSGDGGRTWTPPVRVGASAGSISPNEWWIDGAIGSDAAGGLYATWDTQGRREDTAWLSYSADHGGTWSPPIRVVRSVRGPNIVQVVGGPAGIAYLAWLSRQRRGYVEYLRPFSIVGGWLSPPHQVSRRVGDPSVWPGDTFGLTVLAPNDLMLSWGSATPSARGNSEIFATRVELPPAP